jgi:glycosyltransferase involved in cell wall biosynthesis
MSTYNQPLVSVLMTVYNREIYIAEAIESVINSTYKNWELIIVDDRSDDKSLEIAKQYEEKDSRISVYLNSKNLGDYPNRNKAASYAKGEFINYVDADDAVYPFGLEQMVYYMLKHPNAAIGICREHNPTKMYPIVYDNEEAIKEHFITKSFLTNAPGSVIIRKACFDAVEGFTNYRHISDNLMWIRLAMKYDIVKLPRELNWARHHEAQELKYRKKKIEPIVKLYSISRMLIEDKSCPLKDKDKTKHISILDKRYFRKILSALKHLEFKKARLLYKHYKISHNESV